MLLIVGLGNPGPEYARQRHNVGFMAVDAIHRRHAFPAWRRRFKGEVSEGTLAGQRVLLLKPLTYMNDSGNAVQEAAHFYKIPPADIVVIHDEVDLPPAKVRLKTGGGTAGHNGLRSIGAAIGDGFRRIRIGIGHPGVKEVVPHYVLHDFAKADAEWVNLILDAIADNAALLAEGKDATLANRIHAALTPDKPEKPDKAAKAAKAGKVTAAQADAPAAPAAPSPAPDKPEGPLARGLRKLFGG
jgi:PTH1 family peptidyl-tRNA hydrolase